MAIFVAIFLALLVAAGVLLAASVASSAKDKGESPFRTFRTAWSGRKNPDTGQRAAAAAAAVEPVDLSLAPLLRETGVEGVAYRQVDDLAGTLQRARDKAAGVLPGNRNR
jgi:hypothetical protein